MSMVGHIRVEGLAVPVDIRENAWPPASPGRPSSIGGLSALIGPLRQSPVPSPPQFLDELRARLPVSDVVGRRVKLKKAGREWKGLSPFNQARTPSFFANDQKGMWFDFSSGRNGK